MLASTRRRWAGELDGALVIGHQDHKGDEDRGRGLWRGTGRLARRSDKGLVGSEDLEEV